MTSSRLPIATLILILLNIGVAFAMVMARDDSLLTSLWFSPKNPVWWTAITNLFAHSNLIHLLSNMVFLAAVAPAVEFAASSWRLLLVYVLGGLGGVALHWVMYSQQAEPPALVGASGAIAACVTFYSVRFFFTRVPLAPNLSVPIWGVVGLWVLLQVLGAILRIGADDLTGGVAFWAHMGGALVGFGASFLFGAPKSAAQQFGNEVLDKMNQRGPTAVKFATESYLKEHPEDASAWLKHADACGKLGDLDHETDSLLKAVELGNSEQQVEALEHLADLNSIQRVSPHRRARLAESLTVASPEIAKTLLSSLSEEPDSEPQKPDAIFALAALEWDDNRERAQLLIAQLLERFPLHPAAERARAKGWTP